ncbi:unnamed protein product [marine sediment metagenome]|uniref:Uncharacterized protein n=1 Tax=marine sediment metagenome TaxID=412755 RepID=X1AYT5_9ZZZZ
MEKYIIKADGKKEQYDEEKISSSFIKAGASPEIATAATKTINKKVKDNMSTDEIYHRALSHLRVLEPGVALKYSLKRAIMDMGPEGFVFEKYIAMIQGTIILLFGPLLKIPITFAIFFKVIGIMFLVAMTIATIGIVLASVIKSMQAFQVITNFLLMPMFFLSGALFPLNNTLKWMNVVSKINPLSYGIDAMRTVILNNPALQLYPLWLDIVVLASVTVVLSLLGAFLFSRQE